MKKLKKLLFNSSESIDFLFTGLIIYFAVKFVQLYIPAVADIPQVYFTGISIIILVIVLQIGSLPFIRSNLFRLITVNDSVDVRFNDGATFEKKDFIIKSGKVTRVHKDYPPRNFASYYLLDDEKYWMADVETENGTLCVIPLDFVFKIRS